MNQRKAGALLSYVYLGLTCIVGLFYTPFALSFLGDSEYGVFAIALSTISFLTILDMGFNQTMIRYVARCKALGDKEGEEKINGMFLILYSAIALIALIVGMILTIFIEDIFTATTGGGLTEWEAMRLKVVFAILLINLVGSFPMGIYTAILNANEGFVVLKGVNILTFILTYGGMTIAMLCDYESVAMAVITTVVSLTMKLIQGIYVQTKYRPRFRIRGWDKTLFREVFAFSFFIFLNIVIDQLYANTDRVILGIVQSSVVVTIYSVGVQFASYFEQLSTSISGVFLPRITELTTKKNGMKEISSIFVRIGRIQFIILGFLMSGFVILGRMFIGLWVGDSMGDAYAIALVVILPAIVPLSQNIGISVIRALNRHRFRSVMYLGIAVLNVGLSIPLAMHYGGFGAACATGLGTCLGQILTMNWFYWKRIGLDIPQYWKEVGKILLGLVPVALAGYGMHLLPFWDGLTARNGWLSFLCQGALYTILFMIVGWLFIFNRYEKDLLAGLARTLMRLCLRVIPLRDDVMFEAHPDFADNSGTVYEELLRRGYNKSHRIYWNVYDEESVKGVELPPNVYCVYKHKSGLRATWQLAKARARCRFIVDSNSYIHKVRGSQVRLHLGHGMPIKLLPEYTNYGEIGACDGYVICGVYWKSIYTEMAHIPEEVLLPIGYPRNDVLVAGSEADKLRREESGKKDGEEHAFFWHIHEREEYILWMPTYRQHRNKAAERSQEREENKQAIDEGRWEVMAMQQLRAKKNPKMPFGMPEVEDTEQLETLDQKLEECGLKIYFRPHPSQDLQYVSKVALSNIRIADDEFLRRCDVSLYGLIADSTALITDYSSVYFDYLLTGKPIGLTLRDAGTFFRDCVCCFDDLEEDLAGFKINSFAELLAFVGLAKTSMSAVTEARGWYHDVVDGSSTARVIEWLQEHGMDVTS
ncbi:MAG: CDP-glycerol glycerophosphotransferase family protein [Eubacterium sp.]|nr:CDP-glycerol glycerophosphotransferase family protein [Eubacterium sp.]